MGHRWLVPDRGSSQAERGKDGPDRGAGGAEDVVEAVGRKKPDPAIFHAAAADLDGAWVIGDSPHADIAGAWALGLTSVWVSGGRPWTEAAYRPTHTAADVVTALAPLSQPDEGGAGHQ